MLDLSILPRYLLPKLYLFNGVETRRNEIATVKGDGWRTMVSDSILV